LNMNF